MKVVFDGVPPDLHTGIEEEIRVQLNSALGSRDPPMIGQFVVTLDFAGFVQRNSPYHSDRVYDPAHDHGIAVARTLPMMEEGELRFVVVIDARRLSLARENRIGRMAVYTHELRHVVDFQCRSTIDGHDWITDVPQQTEEILFENAWKIACEYSGERCAGELLAHVASKLDGTVAFGTTIGLLQTLGTLLSGLEDYLNDNASAFSLGQLSADGILAASVTRVLSILMLCAYVYAIGDTDPGVRSRLAVIERTSDFRRFFAAGWSYLHDLQKRYYREPDYADAKVILRDMGSEIGRILETCGLRLSDGPTGLRLEVLYV